MDEKFDYFVKMAFKIRKRLFFFFKYKITITLRMFKIKNRICDAILAPLNH